jgi:hypothetical protein
MAARAVRAALKLLWIVAKSFTAFLLFLIFLTVTLLLVMVLMDAVGLDDYKIWGLAVAWCVFLGVMIRRRIRKMEYQGGMTVPGSEVHTLGLRRTVQDELSRHRNEPPSPHP